MDMFRMAVGTAMIHQPNSTLSSVVFMGLTFALMGINSYLQSYFSAILSTSWTQSRVVTTPDDLATDTYTVYGESYYSSYYYNTSLERKIISVQDLTNCLTLMKQDPTAACVEDCSWARYNVEENDEVHISRDEIFDRYNTWLFRDDSSFIWPGKKIYIRLFEAGFTIYYLKLEKTKYVSKETNDFRKISLYQLRFAFYCLTAGLILCILMFFMELSV